MEETKWIILINRIKFIIIINATIFLILPFEVIRNYMSISNWFVNIHGYSIGTIHHNISYNIMKYLIIQFINKDIVFYIASNYGNTMKTKMKEIEKWKTVQIILTQDLP